MTWFLDTALPIMILGALGAVVPLALARRFPDTQAGLARALAVSAVLLVFAGTGLFVALYSDAGLALSAVAHDPRGAARHFVGLGLRAAIVWGPVLALTALGLAQGVEARRGARLARRDPD